MSSPTPFLSIFDDAEFIRVFDAQQQTTTYFNKVNISVQMDNDTSFYIKNEDHIGHYNFVNVAFPVVMSLKELVKQLTEWVKSKEEWDLSTATVLMEIKVNVDKNDLKIADLVTGFGTTTYDNTTQSVLLQTNGRVIRSSKQYIAYRAGQDILAILSGTIDIPTNHESISCNIGLFETNALLAQDTPGVGYPSTGPVGFHFTCVFGNTYLVFRFDTFYSIPRAQWNMDKLDGTGPSGVSIDFKKPQEFVFEMRNRQGTAFRAGIMYNNNIIFCHDYVNYSHITRLYKPSLPLRWYATGNGSAIGKMYQGNAIVYSRQRQTNQDIRSYSTNTTASPKVFNAGDQNKNLITLSLVPECNRNTVRLTKMQLINTEIGYAQWDLVLAPTSLGISSPANTSFTKVPNSCVRKSEVDVIISGGTVIASGYIPSQGT